MKLIFSSIVLNYPALAVCAVTSQRPVLWSKKQLEELKHNCTKSRSLAQTLNKVPSDQLVRFPSPVLLWSVLSTAALTYFGQLRVISVGSICFLTPPSDFEVDSRFRTFPSPFGHFRLIVLPTFGGLRLILEGFVLFRTVSPKFWTFCLLLEGSINYELSSPISDRFVRFRTISSRFGRFCPNSSEHDEGHRVF